MKKLFLFLAMASTTMFVSCGSDDNGGAPPTNPPVDQPTAITLAASATAVEVNTPVTFTVTNDLNANVTSSSTFTVTPATGGTFAGAVFTATQAGSYSVVAKNGDLTSAAVVITVTAPAAIQPNDSFVVNGTEEFATPSLGFALYGGIQQLEDGTFYGLIAFNPYQQVGQGQAATYPTDLYIWGAFELTSSGVNPETGQEIFTQESVMADLVGSYTFDPESTTLPTLFDVEVLANNNELVESNSGDIQSVTLNITSATPAAVNATYTITLTNGTVIEGEYSGAGNVYTIQASRPAIAAKKIKNAKTANNVVLKGLKSKR